MAVLYHFKGYDIDGNGTPAAAGVEYTSLYNHANGGTQNTRSGLSFIGTGAGWVNETSAGGADQETMQDTAPFQFEFGDSMTIVEIRPQLPNLDMMRLGSAVVQEFETDLEDTTFFHTPIQTSFDESQWYIKESKFDGYTNFYGGYSSDNSPALAFKFEYSESAHTSAIHTVKNCTESTFNDERPIMTPALTASTTWAYVGSFYEILVFDYLVDDEELATLINCQAIIQVPIRYDGVVDTLAIGSYADNMYIDQNTVEYNDPPVIRGGNRSMSLLPNTKDSFKIPNYGIGTGALTAGGLEFWVNIVNNGRMNFDETLINSAKEIIKFSNISNLSLFDNQLILQYDGAYEIFSFDLYDRPILVNINYTADSNFVYFTIYIDGIQLALRSFQRNNSDFKSLYMFFSNPTIHNITYGPIAVYPYSVNFNLIKKHYVYGLGTKIPQSMQELMHGRFVEFGELAANNATAFIEIPNVTRWEHGKLNNLETYNNKLQFIERAAPTYTSSAQSIDSTAAFLYRFNNLMQYYMDRPHGIGFEFSPMTEPLPDNKYIIASFTLGNEFVVFYQLDFLVQMDYRIEISKNNFLYVQTNLEIEIDSPDRPLNINIVFDYLRSFLPTSLQGIFDSNQTTLHIGHMAERFSDSTIIDNIQAGFYFDANIESVCSMVKFFNKTLDYTLPTDDWSTDYENGAVNWENNGTTGEFYQRGSWTVELPLTVLTKYVSPFDKVTGNETDREELDYIQFNVDSTNAVNSYITIYTNSKGYTNIERDNTLVEDLSFSDIDGYKISTTNNSIIDVPADIGKYEDKIIRIWIEIENNQSQNRLTTTNVSKARVVGITNFKSKPSIIKSTTGHNIVRFERTDSMTTYMWNNDVKVIIPSATSTIYNTNENATIALADDDEYWDVDLHRGFLIPFGSTDSSKELYYGYSAHIKVDFSHFLTTYRLFNIATADAVTGSKFGALQIVIFGDSFYLLDESNSVMNTIYVNGELYNPSNTTLYVDRWYHISCVLPDYITHRLWKDVNLEVSAPSVNIANIGMLTMNSEKENYIIMQYLLDSQKIGKYLYNTFIGNYTISTITNDSLNLAPTVQSAWTSAYINTMWHDVNITAV